MTQLFDMNVYNAFGANIAAKTQLVIDAQTQEASALALATTTSNDLNAAVLATQTAHNEVEASSAAIISYIQAAQNGGPFEAATLMALATTFSTALGTLTQAMQAQTTAQAAADLADAAWHAAQAESAAAIVTKDSVITDAEFWLDSLRG